MTLGGSNHLAWHYPSSDTISESASVAGATATMSESSSLGTGVGVSFNRRRVTSMMVSGHLHDYYNGPLSSLILTCVSLLQLIVLLFIINDSISILHVHATAPFAWTYVNGPSPIKTSRVKAVGALGVEVRRAQTGAS
jgi:hypothetical protein